MNIKCFSNLTDLIAASNEQSDRVMHSRTQAAEYGAKIASMGKLR